MTEELIAITDKLHQTKEIYENERREEIRLDLELTHARTKVNKELKGQIVLE